MPRSIAARPYQPLKPFFSYFGSKHTLVNMGLYPPPIYPLIIEAFAGSAGYALHYYRHEVLLNDINPIIVGIWRYLIRVDEATLRKLPHKFARVPKHLEPAERALIGYWLARGVQSPRTKATPWAKQSPDQFWGPRIKERLISQLPCVRHWVTTILSYRQLPDFEATWFIDPPYQARPNSYPYCDIDYGDLRDWVHSRKGQVIVCESENANWLPDFTPIAPARKKTSGRRGDLGLYEQVWYRTTGNRR